MMSVLNPLDAMILAAVDPAGPAPTTIASASKLDIAVDPRFQALSATLNHFINQFSRPFSVWAANKNWKHSQSPWQNRKAASFTKRILVAPDRQLFTLGDRQEEAHLISHSFFRPEHNDD